jgi:SAM-dependent methyltransferase
MSAYSFEEAQREWSRVPNDVQYVRSEDWLALPDDQLRHLVTRMERERYSSWRNWEGLWRSSLGLDTTRDRTILDFGCGIGMEALQFARQHNRLIVADINDASIRLAQRVLGLFGHEAGGCIVRGEYPFVEPHQELDVFYANGVLHHTPAAPAILRRAAELLSPSGEVRLMLYSDRAWELVTSTPCPRDSDHTAHPAYQQFLRGMDQVGCYAEPWWPEKLSEVVGGVLELEAWTYLVHDGRYAAAVLRPV